MRRASFVATLLALLAVGVSLRLFRWREAPPGPWIDEALALRAARIAAATDAPLLGTSPLQPRDAGFVNSWVTNLSLRGLAVIDRLAGGGIASVRAMSLLPAIVLLLALVAAAWEASRRRPFPTLAAALLGATSSWLLVTGRWGWNAVATSAVVAIATWAALRAARTGSPVAGAAAGALLGLSFWGYVAAWALLPLPALILAAALLRRRRSATPESRRAAAVAGAGLAAFLVAVAPISLHFASHPDRAIARARELSATRAGAEATLPALGRNALAYARLFAVGGDPNERHGDPDRPVLPAAVTALALVGAASGVRSSSARLLSAAAVLYLAASLLAVEESANAYRLVHAAPFLLLLAALGADRLADLGGPGKRPFAVLLLGLVLAAVAGTDALGFLRWLSSPRLEGAFGGPERALADAVAVELAKGGPADVVLAPGAARNAFVVDALLQPPSSGVPAVRQGPGFDALRYLPSRDLLLASAATGDAARVPLELGATRIRSGGALLGFPGWALWRLPADRARAAARAFLDRFPTVPAAGEGTLVVRAEGLYTFASRGGLEARLDGRALFDASRPAGTLTARLAAGRHDLAVKRDVPEAQLRVTGPDGFVLPGP